MSDYLNLYHFIFPLLKYLDEDEEIIPKATYRRRSSKD